MPHTYEQLVEQISQRFSVSPDLVIQRARNRRAKLRGLISPSQAAHTVALTLALTAVEHKLALFLAAGAQHVSGLTVSDAVNAARDESAPHRLFSLGYWPQANEAPASVAAHYVSGIEAIARAGLACSLSVKVDQLDFDATLWQTWAHLHGWLRLGPRCNVQSGCRPRDEPAQRPHVQVLFPS